MNKLLSTLGLAISIATVSLLAGCQLYFGDHSNTGGGSDGNPPGFACTTDAQCAAGCFCEEGVCAEGGFCGSDKDCGPGFQCEIERSSCIPKPACTANEQCAPGSRCDAGTGDCVATCSCTSDAEAVRLGAGWCDEARNTCMPGNDPAGTCTGAVTCNTARPQCPAGQVALVADGCFTGECRAIAACEAEPACPALQNESDCLARSATCSSVYTGHGCTKPDGSACSSGDANCTCTSFTFSTCEDRGTNATRVEVGE